MRICAEKYLLINFIMNLLILSTAYRGHWFCARPRVVAAALVGAVYALFETALEISLAFRLIALPLTLLIAFPLRDKSLFLQASFMAACLSMCVSAVMRAVINGANGAVWAIPLGILAGGTAARLLAARLRIRRMSASVLMRVNIGNDTREFTALVDTGNLLTEPLSALPVLIADEQALGRHITRRLMSETSTREIAFSSVGGDGGMRCAKPDRLEVLSGLRWKKVPDMWLGLYSGNMNKGVHALAPVSVLRAIKTKINAEEAYS